MFIVRQRSLRENPAVRLSAANPSNSVFSYGEGYSEWTPWSKCRKRCKQVRRRYCLQAEICQSNILKEERKCSTDQCNKNSSKSPNKSKTTTHSHSAPRQRFQQNNIRVLYELDSLIYGPWSSWANCSPSCHTQRSRECIKPELCENPIHHDYAFCYLPGTDCERKYNSGRNTENEVLPYQELNFPDHGVPKIPLTNSPIDDVNCGQAAGVMSPLLRIIGGHESNPGRWPWMVAVLNKNDEAFCGGTLITPYFVVTAGKFIHFPFNFMQSFNCFTHLLFFPIAHCVRKKDMTQIQIRAGEHNLFFDEGNEQQRNISEVFVHPKYDPVTVDNDIALLKLRQPLKINKHVSPVCLPKDTDVMKDNARGTILGWGKRRPDAIFGTDALHAARVPITNAEVCKKVYSKYYISDNMVCAGLKRGQVDSCAGDSGGPLLFRKKETNRFHLYGITSFGEGCGRKGRYGIYAKVPNMVNWIRETIEKASN